MRMWCVSGMCVVCRGQCSRGICVCERQGQCVGWHGTTCSCMLTRHAACWACARHAQDSSRGLAPQCSSSIPAMCVPHAQAVLLLPTCTTEGDHATHKVHRLRGDGYGPPAQLVGRDHPLAEVRCQRLRGEVQWVKGLVGDGGLDAVQPAAALLPAGGQVWCGMVWAGWC